MSDVAAGRLESSLAEFCVQVAEEAAGGDLNTALARITDLVREVMFHPAAIARVFSSPELDELCGLIGRLAGAEAPLAPVAGGEPREDHVVYLVTVLPKVGGHTRVLADLVRAERAARQTILISGVHEATDLESLADFFPSSLVALEVAPPGDFLSCARWLQTRLAQLRPCRTYLLNHHYDAAAIAAAQPDLVGKLIYIHHADHMLTLGMHLPHARHVDLHALGFYHCREHEGVVSNVVWPVVAADQGHRVDAPFLQHGHPTTCTSGRFGKFEFSYGFEPVPYLYSYEQVVPLIIEASGGTHIHIGELSHLSLDNIQRGLAVAGLSSKRFVHIPYVPNLWRALLERGVDVYIGSFPHGGGRTVVEAMGAGLPLIIHSSYYSGFVDSEAHVYEGAMIWRQPAELIALLSKLEVSQLVQHARRSRAFYEAHHRPELLRAAIDLENAGGEPQLPARPLRAVSRLQDFFDEREAFLAENRRRAEDAYAQLERELEAHKDRIRMELERDCQARDDGLRAEIERARAEAIESMTIPVRVKRVLTRTLRKVWSLVPERIRFSPPLA
jgi:hypothetical protein